MNEHLLSDSEVARFLVTGYHLVEPELPAGLNESIAAQLDALDYESLATPSPKLCPSSGKYSITRPSKARSSACSARITRCSRIATGTGKQPNSPHMNWHQDGLNNRDVLLNRFLGLYYPTDVTPDMGPTIIVPGTQFRNAPTDRMATYTNIRGQVPLVVKAGTVAFTHYDLWHGTAANRSPHKRHMIKFLFRRTQDNTGPTWNHDPEAANKPADWNERDRAEDVTNILNFTNPLGRLPERPLQGARHPPPETGTISWACRPNLNLSQRKNSMTVQIARVEERFKCPWPPAQRPASCARRPLVHRPSGPQDLQIRLRKRRSPL